MGVQVKICGINSLEAAEAAARARADLIGLLCVPGSPRSVLPALANAIARHVRGSIRTVALLVDPIDEHIKQVIGAIRPDFLQLHGQETPERVAQIRAAHGIPIIKVLQVAEAADLTHVSAYEKAADRLLFDAKPPTAAQNGDHRAGGHGVAFDWQLLRGRNFGTRWFLAGGLTPENVARAIQSCGAPGVDVSSGVETAPGVKSADLMKSFIDAARNARYAKDAT